MQLMWGFQGFITGLPKKGTFALFWWSGAGARTGQLCGVPLTSDYSTNGTHIPYARFDLAHALVQGCIDRCRA